MANVIITQDRHPFTGRLEPYEGANLSASKLAPGHFVTAQFAMRVVSPRPDSETGSFAGTVIARHRWAYYDGVNPVRYEYPVEVFGGSAPHIFELLSGPLGMTIGNSLTAAEHGVIKWTPTQAYSTSSPAIVVVRIYDQNLNYVEVAWTIATSSSTTEFMFVDNGAAGNDTTGTGAIGAPFKTLAKVTGATVAATTYPGRIIYLRGSGTAYATAPHSDHGVKSPLGPPYTQTNIYICVLSSDKKPNVFLSFPDENVTIDFSNSELRVNSNDFYLAGSTASQLRVTGSATLTYESHNIWLEMILRTGFAWIDIDGFIPRNAYAPALVDRTNFSPIHAPYSAGDEATANGRMYGFLHGVREINRTVAIANDGLLHILYATSFWVESFCEAVRSTFAAGAACVHWKDGNWNTSVRYCNFGSTNNNYDWGFSFSDQTSGGKNEIVYSKVQGPIMLNGQATGGAGKVGPHFVGRCSVISTNTNGGAGRNCGIRANPNSGATFVVENCAGQSNNAPFYDSAAGVVSTGNECQSTNGSGNLPLDTSLNLKNSTTQYRTLYLGTRGAEIA